MRLLLDTNVVIRMVEGDVSNALRDLLQDTKNTLLISAISLLELAIKDAKYGLGLPPDFRERLTAAGCNWLGVTPEHAWAVRSMPALHGDPFDRLIVAQAMAEDLVLVSTDRLLPAYGLPVIRA